jgi:hypothetical protein
MNIGGGEFIGVVQPLWITGRFDVHGSPAFRFAPAGDDGEELPPPTLQWAHNRCPKLDQGLRSS